MMESNSEISASALTEAGISGILGAQGAEQEQPQELQHSGPKEKRDNCPSLFALHFHGREGSSEGLGAGAPLAPVQCRLDSSPEQASGRIDIHLAKA